MSNVVEETDEESGEGSGKNGRFIGADLANLVQYDPSLETVATGATMSEADAIARLGARLPVQGEQRPNGAQYGPDQLRRDVAALIVTSLPESMWTEGVLDSVDLRPYLEALDGKKIRHWQDIRWGVDRDTEFVVETKSWLEAENARLRDQVSQTLVGLTIDEREAKLDQMLVYDKSRAGFMPTGADLPTTGAVDENGEPLNPLGTGGTVNNPQVFFPEADMRAALQTGMTNLMGLVQEEQAINAELGGGQFNVPVMPSTFRWDGDDRGAGGPTSGSAGRTLSASSALNYLSTLSEKEVRDMQLKLANAGYFDRTSSGGYFVEGYAYDEATREAWQLLLTDSIQQNKPVTEVLGRNMREYRSQVQRSRLKAAADTDMNYVTMVANDWAQAQIGRDLTSEELSGMRRYLDTLTANRATFVAGASDNITSEGLLDGEGGQMYGFAQGDIQSKLTQEFAPEVLMARQQERSYWLSKQMGD